MQKVNIHFASYAYYISQMIYDKKTIFIAKTDS